LSVPPELWTSEKIIDELFLHLTRVPDRKYYRRGAELERWIPIARPPPEYIIDKSDLTDRLRNELLDEITSNDARQYVLKEAVGRIFENLNFERYHLSIARNLKVRLA
jgi:hypothetical protein